MADTDWIVETPDGTTVRFEDESDFLFDAQVAGPGRAPRTCTLLLSMPPEEWGGDYPELNVPGWHCEYCERGGSDLPCLHLEIAGFHAPRRFLDVLPSMAFLRTVDCDSRSAVLEACARSGSRTHMAGACRRRETLADGSVLVVLDPGPHHIEGYLRDPSGYRWGVGLRLAAPPADWIIWNRGVTIGENQTRWVCEHRDCVRRREAAAPWTAPPCGHLVEFARHAPMRFLEPLPDLAGLVVI